MKPTLARLKTRRDRNRRWRRAAHEARWVRVYVARAKIAMARAMMVPPPLLLSEPFRYSHWMRMDLASGKGLTSLIVHNWRAGK